MIFGVRNLESLHGLSCGVVCVILRLAVLVELRLVTDRQTDTGPWLVKMGCHSLLSTWQRVIVGLIDEKIRIKLTYEM